MTGILAALLGSSGGRLLTVGTYTSITTNYGYSLGAGAGSFSPREFLGANITTLLWTTANELLLGTDNSLLTNSGWTSIVINGTTFLRTAASYASGIWTWTGVSTNPIGTTVGAILPVNIG